MTDSTEITAGNSDPSNSGVGSQRILDAAAVSVSWLVAIACIHLMYVVLLLFGSLSKSPAILATLTQNGQQWYEPEREIPIYIAGCMLTIALSISVAIGWRHAAITRSLATPTYSTRVLILGVVMAAFGSGLNLSWLIGARVVCKLVSMPRAATAGVLVLPAIAELALLFISIKARAATDARGLSASTESEVVAAAELLQRGPTSEHLHGDKLDGKHAALNRLIDIAVVLFIWLVVYIPRTDLLAGRDYIFQHFHHWDFFAMGPAIGLLKGLHLGTQVYCQYGFGWPIVLAKLDPVFRLSYGHAYKIAVISGCIYYCSLYWLLRRLLANPAWAIAGLMLALHLQVFHGGSMSIPLWFIPSASSLRTPCDMWVLLILLEHWKTQRPALLVAAGALTGLGLLFIIDTGIYLTAIFMLYNLIWLTSAWRENQSDGEAKRHFKGHFIASIFSFATAGAVLFGGMLAASGRDVFSHGYIHHWLEVLSLYPSGISMLPMSVDVEGVRISFWFVALFVVHLDMGFLRFITGKLQANDVIVFCVAALGLMYLVYYIGNSHAYSILQLSTPFCILAVYSVERIMGAALGYTSRLHAAQKRVAFIALPVAVAAVLLITTPMVGYPNVIESLLHRPPAHSVCYFADIQDVCASVAPPPHIQEFQQTVLEMQQLTKQGKTFAVIANDDTALYVASRATLWNRYTPLLPSFMTKSMLSQVGQELSRKPVDYVFIKSKDPILDSYWAGTYFPITTDSWTLLSATTRRLYQFDHICGTYEVWRR